MATKVDNGIGLIQFAVSKDWYQNSVNICKLQDNEWKVGLKDNEAVSNDATLKIPFDDTRYENVIAITFH
jgi:hypothetical protein